MTPDIREARVDDVERIEGLYPRAFPDEDLLPLLRSLHHRPEITLSLVACADSQIAGHVLFTDCRVGDTAVALLAPLAVDVPFQRQGVGSALIHDGLKRLRSRGSKIVCVLGDPNYYGRLGFTREDAIDTPYPLPEEWADAWQSITLGDVAEKPSEALSVPAEWQQKALWSA